LNVLKLSVTLVIVLSLATSCASIPNQWELEAEISKFSETQYREAYAYVKQRVNNRIPTAHEQFFVSWKYVQPEYASRPAPFMQDRAFMQQLYADMDWIVSHTRACCAVDHARSWEATVERNKAKLARISGNAEQAKAAEEQARRALREGAEGRERSLAQGEAIGAAMTSAVGVIAATRSQQQQTSSVIASQQAQRDQIERDNERYRQMQTGSAQQSTAPTPQPNAQQEEIERLRRQVAALEAQQQRQGIGAPAAQVPAPSASRKPPPVAQDTTPLVESFWRNNVYYLRNNGSRRVQCQVSGMVGTSGGIGIQPGLQPTQKAVTIWPNSEEAPFPGQVGNPRFFGCEVR
jgi:hypothetical protein